MRLVVCAFSVVVAAIFAFVCTVVSVVLLFLCCVLLLLLLFMLLLLPLLRFTVVCGVAFIAAAS